MLKNRGGRKSGLIYPILTIIVLISISGGCASRQIESEKAPPSTSGVRDQGNQLPAQSSLAIVRSAIQEAKALPAGDVIRIGNQYPEGGFLRLPDQLDGRGQLIENQFAVLPRGANCKIEAESSEAIFTSTSQPVVTMTRIRIIPSAGIVVKDYSVYWNGQYALLRGIWVFVDDDGRVAKVVSAKGE